MQSPNTQIPALATELYEKLLSDALIFLQLERAAIEALWIWDLADRNQEWISARFWESLGYESESSPKRFGSWRELANAEDLINFERKLVLHLENPTFEAREVIRFYHASGLELSTEVFALGAQTGDATKNNRVIGLFKAFNRERQLEALLEETNRQAQIGSWSWNIVTNKLYWTPLVRAIHEIDDPEYVPSVDDGINFYREGYSREKITKVLKDCLENGGSWDVSLELVTAKGNIRWVRAVGHAERHEGRTTRVIGSFQDIHEQKLRILKLASSEALLSESFDLAPNGMLMLDSELRIQRMSRSFSDMLGYTDQELLGYRIEDLTHPEDLAADQKMIDDFRSGVSTSGRLVKRFVRKDGEIVWVDAARVAVQDEEGHLRGISVQLIDITQARAAEAYRVRFAFLEDKAREMEQFAYIASHDLRQPILTLKGYLQALREDYEEKFDTHGRTYLDVMEGAIHRMDLMIRGLLDYSRLSKIRQLEKVDLSKVVDRVLADLEGLRKAVQGRIHVASLPVVWGHDIELGQVFQNLIANSLKYNRPHVPPIIEVSCTSITGGYEFCIKDNGIGISESDQDRIFGLFQRVGLNSNKAEGSGIGLASCKTIVERHGGSISVRSNLGEGSTFCFSILTDQFK